MNDPEDINHTKIECPKCEEIKAMLVNVLKFFEEYPNSAPKTIDIPGFIKHLLEVFENKPGEIYVSEKKKI